MTATPQATNTQGTSEALNVVGSQNDAETFAYKVTTTLPTDSSRSGVVVGRDAYNRLQGRIKDDLGRQSPSAWIGAAFAFLGIAASGVLGILLFPTKSTQLPPGTKGYLVIVAVSAGTMFLLCLIAHRSKRHANRQVAEDICAEMDLHCGIQRLPSQRRTHGFALPTGIIVTLNWGRRGTPETSERALG
jgi:hypothetical protein